MLNQCVLRVFRKLCTEARNGKKLSSRSFKSIYNPRVYSIRERIIENKITSSVTTSNRDKIQSKRLAQISSTVSIDHILDLMNGVESPSVAEVSVSFTALDALVTKQIHAFPWTVKEQPILCCIQSNLNSESKQIYRYLNDQPEFAHMCSLAADAHKQFTNAQLLSTTLCLLKLTQASPHHEAVITLLSECQSRQESFQLDQLVIYSDIANLMKRNGFSISAYIANSIHKELSQLGNISEENFINLIKILYNVGYFVPGDAFQSLQERIYNWTKHYFSQIDTKLVIILVEILSRFASTSKPELLGLAFQHFQEKSEELSSWELLRIIMFLRASNYYPNMLLDKMVTRADELIKKGNLLVADVISLTTVYEFAKFPRDSRKTIEELLLLYLEDVDIILLRYLTSTNTISSSKNPEVNLAFYRQIWNRKSELYDSISCLLSVVNCLAKIPSHRRSRSLDGAFSKELLHFLLKGQLSLQPNHLTSVGRYLLQCLDLLDSQTISAFHRRLVNVLPNTALNNIIHLGSGITSNVRRRHFLMSEEIPEHYPTHVAHLLARESLRKIDQLRNVEVLNILIHVVFMKTDHSFLRRLKPQICSLYLQHADSLSTKSLISTVKHLKYLRLNLPPVLEKVASFILKSPQCFSQEDLCLVLDCFAYFDYHCDRIEELCELLVEREELSQMENVLTAVNSLATVQYFPEKLLSRVFSLEFLSNLDNLFKIDASDKHKQTMLTFLELNRSTFLQCPHLPFPWIATSISKMANDVQLYELTATSWKSIIYEGFLSVLGGNEYIHVGPLLTSYGHVYDFECRLDKNRCPVPINSEDSHFRVAVLLSKPHNYSANDRLLLGPARNTVTQLEILGFTVVQVPYFNLELVKFADPQTRIKYFSKILFCD